MATAASHQRRDSRGLSESVQWALLTPLILLCVLGLVQAGVVLHARNSVRQAALAGAETQALLGADPTFGAATAERVARAGDLSDVTTQVQLGPELVTVTVTGRARIFFDLGQGRVSATATWPRERA